ncbi:MAG: cytochrome c-type biogenesis protein CcmH [Duodenibacillus sp.]|nr:cytochrome c-type biogenesis protein CcmH [Duodenibacillus sp.]
MNALRGGLAALAAAAVLAAAPCAVMDAAAAPGKEAAPTAFDPVAHKRVLGISEQLRCLVCQNQSIADSNAELAVDLRNQVIEQIKAGKSDKQIIDYMVERYGDFVLYNPPLKASTVILWAGPAVLFVAALLGFYINLRRRRSVVASTERRLTPDEKRRAEALLKGQ